LYPAYLVFGFLVLLANSSASSIPNDVLTLSQRVDRHYNALHTLQTDFIEKYSGNGINRTESGTLWIKRPGRMRWEYREPRSKLFISDGKTAWFYAPGDQQARSTPSRN
jgi:outer membrane lipoprotein carrier protein